MPPATDVINVFFATTMKSEIQVFNLLGEIVFSDNNVMNRMNKVDMSNQANGVYFVKVKTGQNIITKKVIVSK